MSVRSLDPRHSTTRRVTELDGVAPGMAVVGPEARQGGLWRQGLGKAAGAGTDRTMPVVTVITVVRNGERYLEEAIRSVLEQDYDNIEYIIVDGASGDATLEIVERYENALDYWVSEPDAGLYDGMNKGLDLARGSIIGILNADDRYRPGAVSRAVAAVAELEVDYTYGPVERVDADGAPLSISRPLPEALFWSRCWAECPFPHPSLFVRSDVYAELGTFDTTFPLAADRDFMARLIRGGYRGAAMKEPVAVMRAGGMSAGLPGFAATRRLARKYDVALPTALLTYLGSVAKQLMARVLPRPLVAAALRLKGSRHQWTG